jgi:hypothetical protein
MAVQGDTSHRVRQDAIPETKEGVAVSGVLSREDGCAQITVWQ